jgi:hypothetical protein
MEHNVIEKRNTARARLDADRTAIPKTRLIKLVVQKDHVCLGQWDRRDVLAMTLVNDETGESFTVIGHGDGHENQQ